MPDITKYNELKRICFERVFSRLNDKQLDSVCAVKGPVLVLAGAGSGKTTVLVNRVYNVLNFGTLCEEDREGADAAQNARVLEEALGSDRTALINAMRSLAVRPASPDEMLCITFTNKAADEFKQRLGDMLGDRAEGLWAGTFHSVCVRILRRNIGKLGFSNSFAIYDADDTRKLVKQIIKDKNYDEKAMPEKYACAAISSLKEKRILPEEAELESRDSRESAVAEIYEEYQKRLKAASALDFDDIILNTLILFEEYPDILEKYARQFRYIFVDEYQDTNPSQNDLVLQLGKVWRNVCVVGDDDQSIYSFRGAAVENILQFDSSFPEARIIKLEQNYRSTSTILDAANALIAHNAGRKGKNLWTSGAKGEKIKVRCTYTQLEEADFIKDEITRLKEENEKLKDIAVLYRANALSRSIETSLVKARIPYRVYGGIKYYERKEIKDIIAYLSLVSNRADDVRLRRVINVPRRAIGETTVDTVAALAEQNGTYMYDIIAHASSYPALSRSCAKLESFYALVEELADFAKEHKVSELIEQTIDATGYDDMLRDEYETDRRQNLRDFVSAGAIYEETAEEPGLEGFLADIALVSDVDSYDANEEAVSLMTVHSAKGLEFGTVFIAGFEQGIFPSQPALDEGNEEEERRLAYVAVTRAKRRLYITFTQSRMIYGMTRPSVKSEFLDEIPPEYKEFAHASSQTRFRSEYAEPVYERPVKNHDFYDRAHRPGTAAPKPQKSAVDLSFVPGQRVEHAVFGAGTVEKCEQMGSDALVNVTFDNGMNKNLMASFAKLKKL
ncbi:MAG: UvrD-helicase domain-containing protein [Clostridia bacterium]|nr:UvrD-helicase domain-containing protein [Clostridia bacterium]